MNKEVSQAILGVHGLRFNADEPFILASRKIGPLYVDVRQLTTAPESWKVTIDELVRVVGPIQGTEAISGGELADLFFSIPVALRLAKPHIAVRKTAKGYGAGGRLVGAVARGMHVVHVSDLITSGTSALDWVRAIREAGGRVDHYVVVFDRGQGGSEALWEQGVNLHALVSLDEEFLAFASERGSLPGRHAESVRRYLKDPDGWATDFLRGRPSFLTDRIEGAGGKLTKSEGLEVLTKGYPELVPELGASVRRKLREAGIEAALA
jgi:orotate phosphoribosyltransferase